MEELNNKLDDLVLAIQTSSEYQRCISLREKLNDSEDVVKLVEEVKKLQKKYVQSNYDSDIKKELDDAVDRLHSIPIYSIYNQELEKVNRMIDYVRDSLNDYFYQLFNNK